MAARVWRGLGAVAAWLLLPLMTLQFLSGYALMQPRILGGVMGKATAFRVHAAIQPLTVAAFVLHGFPWIRRRLAKRRVVSRWLDLALALVGAGLMAFSVYLWSLG
jgi:hypothetical protein